MDYSHLADAQKQKNQQYQPQYQPQYLPQYQPQYLPQYQAQVQQQSQDQQQPYDPAQAYDAFYAAYHQQYYPHNDYAAYQHQQPQPMETTHVSPPDNVQPHHHYYLLPPLSPHPGVGDRSPYRGGGTRGGGPFRGRGGSRDNFSHQPPRIDGGSSHFRGRPLAGPTQTSAATSSPLLPLGWCDICRVDCNSLEILVRHKNGKRHKKTVQIFELIQARQKLLAESQAKHSLIVTESQAKIDGQPEMVVQVVEEQKAFTDGEENSASSASENVEYISLMSENKMGIEQQSPTDGETMTVAPLMRRPRMDGYDGMYPPKRKMMGFGRGGKRPRYFDPVRIRPPRRVRPKEQPRFCTLCNIMCDTQAVFECHLAGKKHTSRVKRFQEHGAVFGEPPLTEPQTEQNGDSLEKQVSETGGQLTSCYILTLESEGQNIAKEDDLPPPEYGVLPADSVILPGLDIKVDIC